MTPSNKLAVSNIAWDPQDDKLVMNLFDDYDIRGVEIAPTKIFGSSKVAPQDVSKYAKTWNSRNIQIVAIQSVLFGRPDLTIFDSESVRESTAEYLKDFVNISRNLGSPVIVFGSPKNRIIPKGMSQNEANGIAKEFFQRLGDFSYSLGVKICIEPNPLDYGTNFITDGKQGINFVEELANPGIGLHLDAAGMYLANDKIQEVINLSKHILSHFHISAPYLGELEPEIVDYFKLSEQLRKCNYLGWRSVEMKANPNENVKDLISRTIELATKYF